MDLVAEPNSLLFLTVRSLILLGALFVFARAFGRWRRAALQDSARLESGLAELRVQIERLADQQAHQAAEQRAGLEQFRQRLDARLQGGASAAAPRGYELALRLARAGSRPEEIAEASGVTGHEAQLLVRLHGPRQSA